jgi:spore coat polysaccharide biosynthesis protein SpsF
MLAGCGMIARDQVVVIVQARMTSTRLPGKVLAPLAGGPAIVRMMERVSRITRAGRAVVATSRDATDDRVARTCHAHGLVCSRGSLEDVLGRVVAAIPPGCTTVVRLTGDCPLVDPLLVDRHIERFDEEGAGAQYVTNAVVRTYPDGLDVEVVSREMLIEADRHATTPADREHVTPWIRRHARIVTVSQATNLSALRLVLDTPDDYESLAAIYAALYRQNPDFDSRQVYRLLVDRPDLIRVTRESTAGEMRDRMRVMLENIAA